MGLDQYAYSAAKANQNRDFYDDARFDEELGEYVNDKVTKPKELAYWRKHPNLHGWFHKEWESQGNTGDFNGDQ